MHGKEGEGRLGEGIGVEGRGREERRVGCREWEGTGGEGRGVLWNTKKILKIDLSLIRYARNR